MSVSESLKRNMRTILLRLLAWLHCGLCVAVICAAFYEFLGTVDDFIAPSMTPVAAYLRGLLFAVPVGVSYFAIRKLPHLWQFLLASVGIAALSWALMGHPAGAVLAAVTCFFRARARMAEELQKSLFETPHQEFFAEFAVLFFVTASVDWPVTQRLTVISAVLYLLVLLAYRGLCRIDEYLVLNRTMHGLPARRIQRTAGAALAAALILTAVLLLPAAFRVSGDFHVDMSKTNAAKQHSAEQLEKTAEEYYAMPEEEAAPMFAEDDGWTLHIPPVVNYLFFALAVGASGVLILVVIYQIFRNFRFSYTDSRDEVRFLSAVDRDESSRPEKRERSRPALWDRSPNAQIRRQYRKTILRASPEPPKKWQTPAEIETGAGLTVPELHRLYEKARYDRVPCTAEDLRTLKEKT